MRKFLGRLARVYLRLAGWRIEGEKPPYPKLVIVAAFHTSSWDAFLMLVASLVLNERIMFMGKHTLFWEPLGSILRWLGGIPVDRTAGRGAVEQVVNEFRRRERMVFVLSPEGTRRRTTRWKRGFYAIAEQAGVPILLTSIDYRMKVIRMGPTFEPSGDIEADMDIIRDFYKDVTAKYPEKVGPMVVARGRETALANPLPVNGDGE